MVHMEFVAPGVPVSNQSPGTNLNGWKMAIQTAVRTQWTRTPLESELKAVIINFYSGDRPSVDVDNMSKPILDAIQGLVYLDDRQITQAEIAHVQIGSAFVIVGASPLIVTSVQAGNQFVYVRIEDPVIPFPLPGVI